MHSQFQTLNFNPSLTTLDLVGVGDAPLLSLQELFVTVATLLLCYNVGALLLHSLLTVTSIRVLRSP